MNISNLEKKYLGKVTVNHKITMLTLLTYQNLREFLKGKIIKLCHFISSPLFQIR